MNAHQIAYELLKKEGSASKAVLKGLGGAAKGFFASGKTISAHMKGAGVTSPTAHLLAKTAPYVGAAYGGKKMYESPTAQRLRYKVREMKMRRAMKKAQRSR